MQFKYCPQCGSMEFVSHPNGLSCKKCHFQGVMPEGPMDKINEIRKRAPRQVVNPTPAPSHENAASVKELADRLRSLKGKSTSDVEFL